MMIMKRTVSLLSHGIGLTFAQCITSKGLTIATWHEPVRHGTVARLDLPLIYASSTTFTGRRMPFSPDSSS